MAQTIAAFFNGHAGLWQLSTSTLAQAELGTHTEQQALVAVAASSIPGLCCLHLNTWLPLPLPQCLAIPCVAGVATATTHQSNIDSYLPPIVL